MSTTSLTHTLPGTRSRAQRSPWAPLPVLLAGTFMVVLDFFIVNVALPSIQSELHASAGAIEWVIAGYALTSAVFLVAGARLGDRFGRRRMFAAGLALFTIASAACGAAATPTELVLARLVQGVSAALLMPNVLSVITVLYSGEARAKALGIYATVMGLAAVGGQLIGGALIAANPAGLGWRSVFLINVPIGVVALLLCRAPDARVPRVEGSRPRLDRNGARHRRADRGAAAAGRGAPARMAGVDLDLARASRRCCWPRWCSTSDGCTGTAARR